MRARAPTHADLSAIRKFALSLDGATEDFPFGHSVMKVNNKVFAFLGTDDEGQATIALKLPSTAARALKRACCKPTGYGLGKRGWVTVAVAAADAPSIAMLRSWVEESHCAVASGKPGQAASESRRPKVKGRNKMGTRKGRRAL